ncbi:hypothetical protein [Novipirellula artificiosorum]|uniref:Secreted protein n=1 Tax=Novipirellula artificiosorum TaxID=2528016 RepID=A0A5C6E585_9BACT|nr:hypothetical protein [Novipirellula artificiosorum]TWU42586.1 hypothetical protein Poly41_08840 [Novipirellula artificiosorum]
MRTPHNQRFNTSALTMLSPLLIVMASIASAAPPTPLVDMKGRKVLLDERPTFERGWFVVAKSTYWPLCYESLDRMEEARELIGKGKDDDLALSLEKSAAWLGLAASAAMTNGEEGIIACETLMNDQVDAIRRGSAPLSDADLNTLVTLGEICIAKSHLMRASAAEDSDEYDRPTLGVGKNLSPVVKEAEKEIRQAQIEARVEQYRYDSLQSLKHLEAAQNYIISAAKAGGLSLPDSIAAPLPTIENADDFTKLTDFVELEMRPRKVEMAKWVETERIRLRNQVIPQ